MSKGKKGYHLRGANGKLGINHVCLHGTKRRTKDKIMKDKGQIYENIFIKCNQMVQKKM
jgi:hypothetical protein